MGRERALRHYRHAARLTGLQHYQVMREAVDATDGGPQDAAEFLSRMMTGMGDECVVESVSDSAIRVLQSGLRIVRGLSGATREDLLSCWVELWRGAVHSQREFLDVRCVIGPDTLEWTIQNTA